MKIEGKYSTADVYASVVDDTTKDQIKELLDQKFAQNCNIKVMADCHAGKGCVIGTTMKITNIVVPSLVGVDIGCGMFCVNLGKKDIDLIKLDRFIRKKIPSGNDVYKELQESITDITKLKCYEFLRNKTHLHSSLGTLGGGNHFIEIDKDDENNLYLVIHTGSRNIGKQVCEYYEDKAYSNKLKSASRSLINRYKKLKKDIYIQEGLDKLKYKYTNKKSLIPLKGKLFNDYMHDMQICQDYASENRERIASKILEFLGYKLDDFNYFHTIHNYINMTDYILRKGSISAYEGETVLIPINMKDGAIIARGKSNSNYNYSAPHGAGRLMSRREAQDNITLEEFKKSMEGIYSTSVQQDTIDESPFAYKSIDDIIPNILPTVDIIKIIKPIYNYKHSSRRSR